MRNDFIKFQLSKAEMSRISGGAPTVYEYSCRCGISNTTFAFFIEATDQLADAGQLCDGSVKCSYVGQH